MKREILFRGKRIDNQEWVYGDLSQFHSSFYISDKEIQNVVLVQVIPETVGQFIGLTDINGKKIFEGDCVRWDDGSKGKYWRVGEIKWVNSHYEIFAKCFSSDKPNEFWWMEFKFGAFIYEYDGVLEIVGNIHDNPEQ